MSNIINFDFRPKLKGYEGSEPSMRDLVYSYYARHFTIEEAEKFTAQYIKYQEENSDAVTRPKDGAG